MDSNFFFFFFGGGGGGVEIGVCEDIFAQCFLWTHLKELGILVLIFVHCLVNVTIPAPPTNL